MIFAFTFCGILVALAVVGLYHASFSRLVFTLFHQLRIALDGAINPLTGWTTSLLTWNRKTLSLTRGKDGDSVQPLIGGLIHGSIFVCLALADFSFVLLSLNDMYGIESTFALPASLELLGGLSVLLPIIHFGIVLFDLSGKTHTTPLQKLSRLNRSILGAVAVLGLGGGVTLALLLGMYRGLPLAYMTDAGAAAPSALTDDISSLVTGSVDVEFETSIAGASNDMRSIVERQQRIAMIVMAWAPVLVSIACATSFIGILHSLQLLVALGVFIGIALLGMANMVLRTLRHAVSWGFAVGNSVLAICIRVGLLIAQPVARFVPHHDLDLPHGQLGVPATNDNPEMMNPARSGRETEAEVNHSASMSEREDHDHQKEQEAGIDDPGLESEALSCKTSSTRGWDPFKPGELPTEEVS